MQTDDSYYSIIDKNAHMPSNCGSYGFIILPNGDIIELKKKFCHDVALCMIFNDLLNTQLEKDKIDFNHIKDSGQAPYILSKYTLELPVIRFTQRYTYSGNVYYSLWYNDNMITKESYDSFLYICNYIYGVNFYEDVDGPAINSISNNLNYHKVYMKSQIHAA